jgi:hypothetical protein
MTKKDMVGLPSNISNPYFLNTVLHQRALQGRWYTHKSELLFPLSSNTASFVRWKISLFNDASSHLLTNSFKSTCCYIVTSYQVLVHSLSAMSKINSVLDAENNTDNLLFLYLYDIYIYTVYTYISNLYRYELTLTPPQLHKLPCNLTWNKYNYGMCAQVILTYVGGGETVWARYFNATQHLKLWLL